jgi:ABC-type uncharacterized transport system permease subunit
VTRFRLPGVRLEQRLVPDRFLALAGGPASVLLGLAAAALFLLSAGANPLTAFGELWSGSFGSLHAFWGTLVKAIPLMLCGLGLSLAFRMNLWNIGAEGQLYCGAAAAAWFALAFPDAPAIVALPSMVLAAMAAGGLWALVAGALKAYLEVNEIIVTLMLNYIAILGVEFLVYGPWKDPLTFGFPVTAVFGPGAELPVLFGGKVHLGLAFALAAALILRFAYRRTRIGFELAVIGANPRAARYAGMDIRRTVMTVMFSSGALAGLAGMSEVAGLHHRLQPGFSPGYGYTAIIVAWLGNLHPLAIPVVAVLFGGLLTGGDLIQITMRLPLSLINVIQGLILFFILAGEFLRLYRVRLVPPGGADA